MSQWNESKSWSDIFLPEIKSICGRVLIGESPEYMDKNESTDLISLKLDAVQIACRIRAHEWYLKYPNEFTIRWGRPSSAKTELRKIIEGCGDYLFYGFSDAAEKSLCSWFIGDLNVFRGWYAVELLRKKSQPGIMRTNQDGSSKFFVFDLNEMPPNFVKERYVCREVVESTDIHEEYDEI